MTMMQGPNFLLEGVEKCHSKYGHQIPRCHPRLTESELMEVGLKSVVLQVNLTYSKD